MCSGANITVLRTERALLRVGEMLFAFSCRAQAAGDDGLRRSRRPGSTPPATTCWRATDMGTAKDREVRRGFDGRITKVSKDCSADLMRAA
jgi:hypothetical protein